MRERKGWTRSEDEALLGMMQVQRANGTNHPNYDAISAIMGRTPDACKVRVSRLRRRVESRMKQAELPLSAPKPVKASTANDPVIERLDGIQAALNRLVEIWS